MLLATNNHNMEYDQVSARQLRCDRASSTCRLSIKVIFDVLHDAMWFHYQAVQGAIMVANKVASIVQCTLQCICYQVLTLVGKQPKLLLVLKHSQVHLSQTKD